MQYASSNFELQKVCLDMTLLTPVSCTNTHTARSSVPMKHRKQHACWWWWWWEWWFFFVHFHQVYLIQCEHNISYFLSILSVHSPCHLTIYLFHVLMSMRLRIYVANFQGFSWSTRCFPPVQWGENWWQYTHLASLRRIRED